jgi:lipopolysaccharide export system permease protein
MTLVSKYIASTIVRYYALGLLAVLGMVITIDYLTNMDEFLKAQISPWRALQFVLLKLPFISTQLMPTILLMAILIAFGLMSKHNELIILNASGVSIYSLFKPVIVIAVAVGVMILIFSESINPPTMLKANEIKYHEIRKSRDVALKKEDIWIKGPRVITHIDFYHATENTAQGFTHYIFNADFRLIRRLDAKRAEFERGHWMLYDGLDQILDKQTDTFRTGNFDVLQEKLELEPAQFSEIIRRSEEMNARQLSAYIDRIEKEGYSAHEYRVDLYHKTAYPFVCVIMGLIGMGLTARKKLTQGLPIAVSMGIAIAFLYWIFQSFCLSLGYGGILPPLAAAWGANFVFLGGGILLLINAE